MEKLRDKDKAQNPLLLTAWKHWWNFLTGFNTAWRIQGLISMIGKAGGNMLVDSERRLALDWFSDVLKPMVKLHHSWLCSWCLPGVKCSFSVAPWRWINAESLFWASFSFWFWILPPPWVTSVFTSFLLACNFCNLTDTWCWIVSKLQIQNWQKQC